MKRILLPLLVLALPVAFGPPARGLVIEDASPNTTRPADDPGWDHVGRIHAGLNAVYLGNGWAATAKHVYVGTETVEFGGTSYASVPGSEVVIEHNAATDADLKVFRVYPPPRLPVLPLAASVSADDEVMLMGQGRSNAGPVGDPPTGYTWGTSGYKRWGTNHLGAVVSGSFVVSSTVNSGTERTRTLFTQFDAGASAFEASVAAGDSGGALFVRKGASWELAGIMWAVIGAVPDMTSYGDDGLSVDLTYGPYQDQLLAITRPCDDGEDNDSDGLTDDDDPDCLGPGDLSEEPACSDGIDNDADGQIDLADGDCSDAGDLLEAADGDGDLVADIGDNCSEVPNTDQYDANFDGYGNACDADYNDDGRVGVPDFLFLTAAYGTAEGNPSYEAAADHNGDGVIGLPDYTFMLSVFSTTPGPSGLACAGTPPCL